MSGKIVSVGVKDPRFEAMLGIYDRAFPAWEKEPVRRIRERLASGRYRAAVYEDAGVVKGFYLLDVVRPLEFTLFSFLAVDEPYRGEGIGTRLCEAAMAYFKEGTATRWLFIEAEDRQASFYGKLGFLKLTIDYAVPDFQSDRSVPMHLMLYGDPPPSGEKLRTVVREIFIDGYFLDPDDPRIARQLAAIPDTISAIPWP